MRAFIVHLLFADFQRRNATSESKTTPFCFQKPSSPVYFGGWRHFEQQLHNQTFITSPRVMSLILSTIEVCVCVCVCVRACVWISFCSVSVFCLVLSNVFLSSDIISQIQYEPGVAFFAIFLFLSSVCALVLFWWPHHVTLTSSCKVLRPSP